MKKAYKIIAAVLSILVISAMLLGYVLWQQYQTFLLSPMILNKASVTITIQRGSSFDAMVRSLAEQGISTNVDFMRWYGRTENSASQIKAGKYTFNAAPTPVDFLRRIIKGDVDHYAITIVEGWSFTQMMDTLSKNKDIKNTLDGLDADQIMAKLDLPGEHPEGRFLPDTYFYIDDTSDINLLNRALIASRDFLNNAWTMRDKNLPLKTSYEALILASIIEKETGIAQERAEIAGVFTRRLQIGMRLQTDPTVIYGMGDLYKGNIRRRDLKKDTPYNTYTRYGLPPTPIALPGRAAILAALHPAGGKALYFVAKGDGSHQFSATLQEHNRAVAKYQLRKRASK